jgi:hypothetical protein
MRYRCQPITFDVNDAPNNYQLPDEPAELKVSGGSKKHLCHRAESVSVPALHC